MSIIFFLFSFLLLSGCGQKMELVKRRELVLGTFGEITCIAERDVCKNGIEKAFAEIKNLEHTLSYFAENSDINLLNNSQGRPVVIREETWEVLKKASEISRKTEGVFDITISPLLKIWGFYEKENNLSQTPSPELIKATLSFVGYDKIMFDEEKKTVTFKNPSLAIDLGGIAKGYIVDKVVSVLKKEGIKNALVNLGGDIYCLGGGENRKGWKIGIQNPLKPQIIATLNLKDKAIATSGQYENFREIQGKKIGHILDPRCGYPVENNLLSVSVLTADCLTADALATAIFVLGKEKGESILKEFSAEAVIITRREKGEHIWISGGLKDKISF